MNQSIYKPIVHAPHSMKFPNLERNLFIVLFSLILIGIAFGIYRVEKFESNRARIQHEQERKALDSHSAIEVRP